MKADKLFLKPSTSLFPVPAVMVSCCAPGGSKQNIITLAWVGILSSDPPVIGICIRPSRYSYGLIRDTGDFVVNVPSEVQVKALDYCGVVSGRDVDKFKECKLTAMPGKLVMSPVIAECPVNIECKVSRVISDYSESHHMFLGEVVSVDVSKDVGKEMPVMRAKPVAFCNGEYWGLERLLGSFGFSRR